ncbi:MAG: hypothetical protein Q9212_000593 [Teloschistes hypoglaucus]
MPSPNPEPISTSSSLSQKWIPPSDASEAKKDVAQAKDFSNGVQLDISFTPVPSQGVIQEGKHKAKAVMAASGLPVETPPIEAPSPSNGLDLTSNGRGRAEDASPSRKRSRSGTRIIQTPRQAVSRQRASSTERKWRHEKELEQYVTRDAMHAFATSIDGLKSRRTVEALVVERNQSEDWLFGEPLIQESEEERHKWPRKTPSMRKLAPADFFGKGYSGYGNGTTNLPPAASPTVVYPGQRPAAGGRRTRHPARSKKDVATQAEQIEELVPIRLDIEIDNIRLRDTFTWNLHDRITDTRAFALGLVEDFKLPPEQWTQLVEQVQSSIEQQIREYHPHVFIREEALDPHLPYCAYKDDEMRITIKLNITIGQQTLMDQFEWDINNPANAAEDFARSMIRDLALPGEFTTAIAHSIREQSQLFTRGLYVTGHPFDGRPIEDQELKASFLQSPLPITMRRDQVAKDFTPMLFEMNEAELERTELSLSREERRQKRSVTRRGGPALPDLKDRRRTIRTLIVSSVIPYAAESIESSRILKRAPALGKARRSGQNKDEVDDSDDSDSIDSPPDSPAQPTYLMTGTARTRNMRGAATAASAAIRSHVGRSATPEIAHGLHHEPRTARRQPGGPSGRIKEYREESVDENTELIIKFKLPREKFRQLVRQLKNRSKPEPLQASINNPHHSSRRSQSATPGLNTPAPGSMPPPPTTPGIQPHPSHRSPSRNGQHAQSQQSGQTPHSLLHPHSAAQIGRVPAAGPPSEDNPIPDAPPWLTQALHRLQQSYPQDSFEGTMRYTAVSLTTDQPVVLSKDQAQEDVKYMYYPRIRCNDCPGKLYTPGPELGVNNFEVHLKNKIHREKVDARVNDPDHGA